MQRLRACAAADNQGLCIGAQPFCCPTTHSPASSVLHAVSPTPRHISIDSFGACLKRKPPRGSGLGSTKTGKQYNTEAKESVIRANYKFVIAFEGTIADGYVSEKLWGMRDGERCARAAVPHVYLRNTCERTCFRCTITSHP